MLSLIVYLFGFVYRIQRYHLADGDRAARLLHSSYRIYYAEEDSWPASGVRAF